jgi:uncharacterized protein YkwD
MRMVILTLILMLEFCHGGGMMPVAQAAAASPAERSYAERMAELVNRYRRQSGRHPLGIEAPLDALAREHSVAMAAADRLSHDGFPERLRRSGHRMCVENVGWNYRTPDAQLEGWRQSPGHDRNLVDARVAVMGIGVSSGYVTFIACQ